MVLSLDVVKKVDGFTLHACWETGNELTVLFGFSGSGKSMTLSLLAGLANADTGHIRLGERIFFDSSQNIFVPPQKRLIGYVSQYPALFPHMTVKKNILYGVSALPRDGREALVREMVDLFYLKGLEDKFPDEISGGQKQRVSLARALVRKPVLLLLDEPFSALDNPLRLEMNSLLRDLRIGLNIPVILVTHNVSEAYTLADKIIVYSSGSVVQTGAPCEVFSNPSCPDVERLTRCRGSFLHRRFHATGPEPKKQYFPTKL